MFTYGKMVAMGLVAAAMLAAAGCQPEYKDMRPPVDSLDKRDRGLQSKDLIVATDEVAQNLLSLPEMNAAGHQWTIVAVGAENQTTDARRNYTMFVDRLKTIIGQQGRGRVTLIENRERFREMQSRELEGAPDPFGQGGGRVAPGPAGIQPDYFLYVKVQELPNRATSTYRFEFNLTNAKTRVQPWSAEYIVKVAR